MHWAHVHVQVGARDCGWEGGREGGRKEERERGKEGGREGGREGGDGKIHESPVQLSFYTLV